MRAHTIHIVSLHGDLKMSVRLFGQLPLTWTGLIASDDLSHPEELRGAPRVKDLVGPTYGGPGVIRYETRDAAEALST